MAGKCCALVSSLATESAERVLLVDDEQALCLFLKEELEDEGYYVSVAHTSATAWDALSDCGWLDLIILDWTLPDGSGPELCQRMRDAGIIVPVIMLTGHAEVSDRVLALDAGVDDYLVKPFSTDELLARMRALKRRRWEAVPQEPDQFLKFGELMINLSTKTVLLAGQTFSLLSKEYDLLVALLRARGIPCPARTLMDSLWGYSNDQSQALIDVYADSLRGKFSAAGAEICFNRLDCGDWLLSEGAGPVVVQ